MKKLSIIILLIGGFFFNKYGIREEMVVKELEKELIMEIGIIDNESSMSSISSYAKTLKIINSRCVGCTKCARTAPGNFVMNQATGLAEVVSQNNLNSLRVLQAVRVCPTRAITL